MAKKIVKIVLVLLLVFAVIEGGITLFFLQKDSANAITESGSLYTAKITGNATEQITILVTGDFGSAGTWSASLDGAQTDEEDIAASGETATTGAAESAEASGDEGTTESEVYGLNFNVTKDTDKKYKVAVTTDAPGFTYVVKLTKSDNENAVIYVDLSSFADGSFVVNDVIISDSQKSEALDTDINGDVVAKTSEDFIKTISIANGAGEWLVDETSYSSEVIRIVRNETDGEGADSSTTFNFNVMAEGEGETALTLYNEKERKSFTISFSVDSEKKLSITSYETAEYVSEEEKTAADKITDKNSEAKVPEGTVVNDATASEDGKQLDSSIEFDGKDLNYRVTSESIKDYEKKLEEFKDVEVKTETKQIGDKTVTFFFIEDEKAAMWEAGSDTAILSSTEMKKSEFRSAVESFILAQ